MKTNEMNLNDGRLVAQQTLEIKHGSTNSYGIDNESYKYKIDDEHLNIHHDRYKVSRGGREIGEV